MSDSAMSALHGEGKQAGAGSHYVQAPSGASAHDWNQEAERLTADGMYNPANEHDACGVGMVAALDGTPSRAVVEAGITALSSIWHRGALNADGKTGDGAGVHLQLPLKFFFDYLEQNGNWKRPENLIGVGMVFLPRTDFVAQEEARLVIENEIIHAGYDVYCWRQVPIDASVIGERARQTCPEIAQIIFQATPKDTAESLERMLYVVRRRIEKSLIKRGLNNVYLCSLSCRYIIYKGLFQAEQLTQFYPDVTDERFLSNYIIFHQRFSTNTNPSWWLAQPFRTIAHNGEINTLRGNINWMASYEASFGDDWPLAKYHGDITPVITPGISDTGALDGVMELMVQAGKPAPLAKLMLMPPAWEHDKTMPKRERSMFAYFTALVAPWDGPAALVGCDGRNVFAGTDRNGLRPLRYAITQDDLLIVGSEAGMVPVPDHDVVEYGKLGPGEIISVDLVKGKLHHHQELTRALAKEHPYHEWVPRMTPLETLVDKKTHPLPEGDALARQQYAAGYTREAIETILRPMARDGKEPVGSMGDDTPLAVLSASYRGLHHFFRQHFSQVTNPPIDPLREHHVMSLLTRLGPVADMLGSSGSDLSQIVECQSPFLLNHEYHALCEHWSHEVAVIDALFPDDSRPNGLRRGIDAMLNAADKALAEGKHIIVLSDEHGALRKARIPMILAAAALHAHMIKRASRKHMSLIARTAGTLDVHSAAVLIGVGATCISPYIAEASVVDLHRRGLIPGISVEEALANYRESLNGGLLKIMSKMGISVVNSYRGGRNFDAIGLSRALVAEYFPGLISRLSGIGLKGLEQRVLEIHRGAYRSDTTMPLPVGGFYVYRATGEQHSYEGPLIHQLQMACASGAYKQYKRYVEMLYAQPPSNLRDLLTLHSEREAVAIETVESANAIRKRFVAPAMSLGALSPEAHETLAIAMNRIGAQSNSGEGGEDASRFKPYANGDHANSGIKQLASGRFGVTMAYLNACDELQIKIAQGAKPGEGGQLPGFKVNGFIAKLRHATEGVTLISPPPHHDIYSIEDLAQLIYDLKQANPRAIVSVKLVAQSGIGTIATGVAKAMADKMIISGHVGGTGASPYSSIKHAGSPWEMGLAEAHQVLTLNGLRHRVVLQTDGGLKTGRDIVIAAMLGAEEYAIGTLSLVAMGCLLVRQCHSNTCPVGICTQDETLRKHFDGTPEKVIHLMSFIAEEVREILASLGYTSLHEVIGQTHLLQQMHQRSETLDTLDLGPLLAQVNALKDDVPHIPTAQKTRNPVPDTLDQTVLQEARDRIMRGEKTQLNYTVHNTQRSIGTRISSFITQHLPDAAADAVTLRLRGYAGQSLGAFACKGLRMELHGQANDYVGKGLCGASIIVTPPPSSTRASQHHAIIGNTVLYGATSGTLYAAGIAGERFAVRNSGAVAVVEGCGANGCEYMTGGTVVVLGACGSNFAAGMTGGMAFIYDPDKKSRKQINPESVVTQPVLTEQWLAHLHSILTDYAAQTGSKHATDMLAAWANHAQHFVQVCPKEMLTRLPHPIEAKRAA